MGATMKKISVILLLVTLFTPGLAQARVFGFEGSTATRATENGFFNMVWVLLANMLDKNGSQLDPSGCTKPEGCGDGSTTTTTTVYDDNGSQLDPSGEPR